MPNLLESKFPSYLAFLVLAACATSIRKEPSVEDRVLRYKNEYPGFELCLCNEPDLTTNLVTSQLYWQMNEKPICNPNQNSIRIIFSQARAEDQIFRMSKRVDAVFLARKSLKWSNVWDRKGGFTLNETEVKLSTAQSDSLYRAINELKKVGRDNTVWHDASTWKIEAMVNGSYSWFWVYAGRTEVDRNFERFLLELFNPVVEP